MMISKWALVRRNELVDLPEHITIHKDFLGELSAEEFETSFRQLHELFYQMYTDMAEHPEEFGFPTYTEEEYGFFSKEAREIRTVPWKPFYLLLELFAWGEWRNGAVVVDMATFRKLNQVKKTDALIYALENYGFIFVGLKNGKLPAAGSVLEIDYPDNRNILQVLSIVAKKVMATQLKGVNNYFSNKVAFENGFISWNYKLLEEGLENCTLAEGCAYVADKMHDEADRAVVAKIDNMLR
ncbi:MAG: hypothetical protein J6K15_01500, partial [Lachnospiraceae bacterium]|nr:hypothetical protein [Lachnospiraceae bacterium]